MGDCALETREASFGTEMTWEGSGPWRLGAGLSQVEPTQTSVSLSGSEKFLLSGPTASDGWDSLVL